MATKKIKKFGLGGALRAMGSTVKTSAQAAKPAAPTKQTAFMDKQLMAAKQAASTGKQVGTAQQTPTKQTAFMDKQLGAAKQAASKQLGVAQQMATQKQLQDARNAPATSRAPRAPTGKPSTTQARPTTPAATALKGLGGIGAALGRKMGLKKGGAVAHSDVKMDKKVVKKAVGMHEQQMHGGKKSDMTKLRSGGSCKGYATGGKVRGCGMATKGLTKGKMV